MGGGGVAYVLDRACEQGQDRKSDTRERRATTQWGVTVISPATARSRLTSDLAESLESLLLSAALRSRSKRLSPTVPRHPGRR